MDPRIIHAKLNILQSLIIEKSLPITGWRAHTAEHLGPGEYRPLDDWREVADGARWPAGVTVFMEAATPGDDLTEGWDLDRTYLSFGFSDMEGLLLVDGEVWSGLDWAHTRCPAPRAGALALHLEWDSVPRVRCEPGLAGAMSTFHGAQVILVDREMEAAYYDFRFAFEAFNAIGDERRKLLIGQAIEDAMVAFTTSAPRDVILAEVAAARKLLNARLAEIAPDSEGGRLFLTGHTHIDTAWLWPLRETIRKCGRTFATAAWMMARNPEYHFSCSQPQLYKYTREHYPEVYERIKSLVAEGRWETTGAMRVEADCNVSSGEALIRQILHGLRFYREEFGTRPTILWLPDVFGYNAGLPQILAGSGVTNFWTWKLHWQSRNPFPYHLFWWQGVDGSRVLAHIPKLGGGAYNGTPTPQQLAEAWRQNVQKGLYDEQLFPFGFGDGGGGVTEEMLEFARRASAPTRTGETPVPRGGFPGLPACRQGTAEQFFAQVREANLDLPTWVGELYLETHRGTYTSQSRTKRLNRKCELALRGAEMAAVISSRLQSTSAAWAADLRAAWEKVLLHQFHDILPGSSIGEVYKETNADLEAVLATAERIREEAVAPILGRAQDTLRFGVLNSLSWPRDDMLELDIPDVGTDLSGLMHGRRVPVQVLERRGDRMTVLVAAESVPSIGGALLEISVDRPLPSLMTATDRTLENQFFRISLTACGEIASLYDKRAGREVIPEGATANRLQLFQDGPEREAAWNVHATYEKREYAWEGDCSLRVTETGPVRATIRVERTHRNTRLVQDISIYDHVPRIDFRTWVDWQERQTMLKAAFPVQVHTDKAAFEVQFGVLERPTHRNTSWEQEKFEVCAQRWADLSEGGYGVSLLNDCKYGHDVRGNLLRLTLLRGPEWPDPAGDLGEHEFTYALLPHEGDWRQGETVRRAWELNVPLFSVPTDVDRTAISFIMVDGPAIVEALKPADDGDGAILRLYEPHGSRGKVTVELGLPVSEVVACNLVEENEDRVELSGGVFSFEVRPFQVRTFRLR